MIPLKCTGCGVVVARKNNIKNAKCTACAYSLRKRLWTIRRTKKRKSDEEYRTKEAAAHLAYLHKNSHSMFVGHQRIWTDEETEFLSKSTLCDKAIAKRLSRSVSGIRAKRKRIGINKTARLWAGESE